MNKKECITYILSLWMDKEQKLFESLDKNPQTLEKQLNNYFKDYYCSYLPEDAIKEFIFNKVNQYRNLLNKGNRLIVSESFLNLLENNVFVNKKTHKRNLEMLFLLKKGTNKLNKKTKEAIEEILSRFDPNVVKKLSLEIDGVTYSLKEQFIARYARSWFFFYSKQDFQYFLNNGLRSTFLTPNKVKSKFDLQTLFIELDKRFLWFTNHWATFTFNFIRYQFQRLIPFPNTFISRSILDMLFSPVILGGATVALIVYCLVFLI